MRVRYKITKEVNKYVVEMGKFQMHGRIAWYIWMLVHLLSLVGFSKKINVFITWTVNYFSKDRGVQLILRRFDFQKMKAQRKEQILARGVGKGLQPHGGVRGNRTQGTVRCPL